MSVKHGLPRTVREIVVSGTTPSDAHDPWIPPARAGYCDGGLTPHPPIAPVQDLADASPSGNRRRCSLGDSVRTVGRLKSQRSEEVVIIEEGGFDLEVDVSLACECAFRVGSLYQFIGELEDQRDSEGACTKRVLLARVARNVDGLDIPLYYRALEAQEECVVRD